MNFNERVWEGISLIPFGKVTTYKELALSINSPNSARAVGNACNANPFAPKVPCHRVVKSDGKIGGFANGTKNKLKLLKKEGIKIKNNKIVNLEEKIVKSEELKR